LISYTVPFRVKKKEWAAVEWTHVAQHKDRWQVLAKDFMNIRVK